MKYLDSTGLTHLWAKIKNYVATYVTNLNLSGTYVALESGKGLSTNDYTTTEKNKLAGIAAGAEVNVNADWSASSGDAQILNKPSIPSKTSDLTNDSGFITTSDIPEGAAASTTTPKMDGTAAVGTETAFARGDHRHPSDTSKQDTISDLATIRSGAAAGATAYQLPNTGIPATDLASAVQTSLGKADTAMQSSDLPVATTTTPKMNGTAAVGTETKWAKGDHVHPIDTSRAADNSVVHNTGNENIYGYKTIAASGELILQDGFNQIYNEDDGEYLGAVLNSKAPLASPALTGTPTAPTAAASTNNTQIATTAFVSTAVGAVTTSSIGAIPATQKGSANGVASLDANGLVPSSQLPSFVDDVVESYARSGQTALGLNWLATGSASGTVITPESGKIYVLMADSGDYTANSQFRWGGTAYVKLNDGGVSAITNSEIDSITSN